MRDEHAGEPHLAAGGNLAHGVGARAGLECLGVEIAHDAHDVVVVEAPDVAEDQLARLVLAIGQVNLVAGAPPAQAQGRTGRDEAVTQQVDREELARLAVHDGAVVVEDGQTNLSLSLLRQNATFRMTLPRGVA